MNTFIKGMDLSTLPEVERCGGKFYDNGKPGDAAEVSGKREENRGGKTINLVGHATAHSSHAEKLGAAEPCHADHQQRRGERPDEQTRHDKKRIDGAGGGACKQLLGCPSRSLTSELSSSALALLGGAPRLELIDLSIETDAYALRLGHAVLLFIHAT